MELDKLRLSRMRNAGCSCTFGRCNSETCDCYAIGLPCVEGNCSCTRCMNPYERPSYDDDDDDDDDRISYNNANDVSSLKSRISELENEYQKVLEAVEEAKRSVAEEQKRRTDLMDKRDALVRRHFNAAVLRAKLEMSKKEMMDGSCSPALNMSMGQLYDEAVQQGISPEMYNSWIHTRLTGINTN